MNAHEKRLARLNAQRHSSPDYSSDKAMISARLALGSSGSLTADKFYKDCAYRFMHFGDLKRAIYCTQVCLWIMRIKKQTAAREFKLPPVGNYIMPPNAKYDAECDRADRINDSIKLGEIA
jgi:hypothetical protein